MCCTPACRASYVLLASRFFAPLAPPMRFAPNRRAFSTFVAPRLLAPFLLPLCTHFPWTFENMANSNENMHVTPNDLLVTTSTSLIVSRHYKLPFLWHQLLIPCGYLSSSSLYCSFSRMLDCAAEDNGCIVPIVCGYPIRSAELKKTHKQQLTWNLWIEQKKGVQFCWKSKKMIHHFLPLTSKSQACTTERGDVNASMQVKTDNSAASSRFKYLVLKYQGCPVYAGIRSKCPRHQPRSHHYLLSLVLVAYS